MSKCSNPKCNEGYITFITEDGFEDIEDVCPHCKGTGIEPEEKTPGEVRLVTLDEFYDRLIDNQQKLLSDEELLKIVQEDGIAYGEQRQRARCADICREMAKKEKEESATYDQENEDDQHWIDTCDTRAGVLENVIKEIEESEDV